MSDTALKMQAVAMLAQELHVSLDVAEGVYNGMIIYKDDLKIIQQEAADMVYEMLD